MAITVRQTATGVSSTAGANVTITLSGIIAGDVCYVFGGFATAGASNPGISTAGFTNIYADNATALRRFGVWRKVMAGGETSVVCLGTGTSGDGVVYGAIVLTGVNQGIFEDVAVVSQASTAVPNASAITPTSNNCCILIAACNEINDTSKGTVTNYTLGDGSANATRVYSCGYGSRILSGGANVSEDPAAWSAWTSGVQTSVTIAVQPFVQTTLTPTVGAVALSGTTPDTAINFVYAPTVGTLALSGTTPDLGFGTGYAPTVATLALSAGTPAFTIAVGAIVPAAASLALSPTTPSCIFWSAYVPTVASLTLTAATPVAQQIAQAVPGSASLGLSANTPAFTLITSMQPGAGVLALAVGTPVSQQNVQRSGTAASLTLAPTTPPFTLTQKLVPAGTALALSASTPLFVLAVTRTPTVGTLALAATAPTLSWLFDYVPAASALALAPTTPPYTLTTNEAPNSASFALTSSAPIVSTVSSVVLTPAVASIALAGMTPAFSLVSNEYPTAGVLALARSTPALQFVLQTAGIPLTLSPTHPTAAINYFFYPSDTALALVADAPHAVEQIRVLPPKATFSIDAGTPVMVQRFYIGADGIALGLQPKPPRIDWHVMAHAHFNKNFKGQSREGRM